VLHARLPACPTFLPGTRAFPPHPVVICDQFRLPPEVYAAVRIPPSFTLVTIVYRCNRQNAAITATPAQTSLHHLFIPEKSKSEAASTVLEIESAARRALLRNLLSTIFLPSPLFSRQVLHASLQIAMFCPPSACPEQVAWYSRGTMPAPKAKIFRPSLKTSFHRFEIFFRARRAPLKKAEKRG